MQGNGFGKLEKAFMGTESDTVCFEAVIPDVIRADRRGAYETENTKIYAGQIWSR